jgi:hypothetical protein
VDARRLTVMPFLVTRTSSASMCFTAQQTAKISRTARTKSAARKTHQWFVFNAFTIAEAKPAAPAAPQARPLNISSTP